MRTPDTPPAAPVRRPSSRRQGAPATARPASRVDTAGVADDVGKNHGHDVMGSSPHAVAPRHEPEYRHGSAPHEATDNARHVTGPGRSGWSADHPGTPRGPAPAVALGPPRASGRRHARVRSWPLLALATPAAVAVWSGWVGIGQMTGFGQIRLLPGIWNSLHLDTAITLPIGVEAYAAFALRVWLTSSPVISDRTRRFARWSAITALVLGMAGQVAYHLLVQARITRAPWEVTTLVSCLPVLVLGLGSALAHLLRSDTAAIATSAHASRGTAAHERLVDGGIGLRSVAGRSCASRHPGAAARFCVPYACWQKPGASSTADARRTSRPRTRPPARMRLDEARAIAAEVAAAGRRVSRRSLRAAGMHGSNADLGVLARLVSAGPPEGKPGMARQWLPRGSREEDPPPAPDT